MFKNILSSKRIPSTDFTMITPLADDLPNGKENQPNSNLFTQSARNANAIPSNSHKGGVNKKKKNGKTEGSSFYEPGDNMHEAFDQLLDELQIPSTLRPKLAGMDSSVKAAMLKSSQGMSLNIKSAFPVIPEMPLTPQHPSLRRTRSIDTLESPRLGKPTLDYELRPPMAPFALSEHFSRSTSSSTASPRKSSHSRGISLGTNFMSRSQVNLLGNGSTLDLTSTSNKSAKEKVPGSSRIISPTTSVSMLAGTSSTELDVEQIKKLRLLLRNESASWTEDFIRSGGYTALLTRLNEILEVEWREEQHDDQVLHQLLQCFKALSTSSVGCVALRSSCPTPWGQLVTLLYSDKKPGEVATRQLMIELLQILFELYPSSSLPSSGRSPHREVWDAYSPTLGSGNVITLPAPHKSFFSFMRSLLLTPAPPTAEAPSSPLTPHEFIENLHRPRIYKTYLQELSDVCRDYFWVFCHPNNTIWLLSETDESRVEKPRAPGGMTGGVEFEAMNYFTTHLKFINAVAKAAADMNLPKDHELSAHRFHSDMFASGFERLILISRKASTTYYPTLHLELARYLVFAGQAQFELPWTLSRLIGLPPSGLCKNPATAPSVSGRNTPVTPSRKGARSTGLAKPVQ
ncbi:armadillo-type protein [Lentinula raphanica]|uniref:Armadillo-type protein n=1 Tax=Lentinula raphanica TaxID=153919 RepID=A0AA38NZP1_9AGAR|nr:armadillo-type protein [Lentinula raphanica]KAJ3833561.1 armadillo-type protein [Lentinula raphanica]KAJ3967687.1 armadillo-type protein [Lentinula raphanica]